MPVAPVGDREPPAYSAVPIPAERIDAAIDKLDAIIADVMAQSKIPGLAVAVVRGDSVVYAKGFGVREVGKPDPVDTDTVFQLASVSKSIGATVVASAVGKGLVSWSDPVVKYLPDFQLSDPVVSSTVTVGDFYAHRSGLPGAAGDDLEGFGFDRSQILERLRLFPLDPFRISYNYTNFGMTTGAAAVAAATGRSWERLSAELIYEPLGMASTSSTYADFLGRPNRASLHFREGDAYEPLYLRDADAQSPAGGVSSSLTDMAQWLRLCLGGGTVDGTPVVAADQLLAVHTPQVVNHKPQTPDSRAGSYGYGVNIEASSTGHVKWNHSGAFYVGAGTAYAMIPQADVAIVALSNAMPVGAVETITTSFSDLVRTGVVERDWFSYFSAIFGGLFINASVTAAGPPANAAAPRELSAYAGTYRNAYLGDVVVTEAAGTLTLTIGPKGLNAPLTPFDGDMFSWLAPGGNADGISAVTFAGSGSAGQATQLTLEMIPRFDLGVLTRVS